MPADWPSREWEVEYRNEYFSVERERYELPDGRPNDYYRLDFGRGGVIALGVDDGDVIFVRLYRPRLEEELLELPGGGIDDGETATEAAKREFAEETGLRPSAASRLGSYYYTAWSRTQRTFVWVDDFVETEQYTPEPEVQDVERVPVDDALGTVLAEPGEEWNIVPLVLAHRQGFIELL